MIQKIGSRKFLQV